MSSLNMNTAEKNLGNQLNSQIIVFRNEINKKNVNDLEGLCRKAQEITGLFLTYQKTNYDSETNNQKKQITFTNLELFQSDIHGLFQGLLGLDIPEEYVNKIEELFLPVFNKDYTPAYNSLPTNKYYCAIYDYSETTSDSQKKEICKMISDAIDSGELKVNGVYKKDETNNVESTYTPFHFACKLGCTDIVKVMLSKTGDKKVKIGIKTMDENKYNAFHIACYFGYKDILELLINSCSIEDRIKYLNIECSLGHTPLMFSIAGSSQDLKEIMTLLIKNGANINHLNNTGQTVLSILLTSPKMEQRSENECLDIVMFLLNNGLALTVGNGSLNLDHLDLLCHIPDCPEILQPLLEFYVLEGTSTKKLKNGSIPQSSLKKFFAKYGESICRNCKTLLANGNVMNANILFRMFGNEIADVLNRQGNSLESRTQTLDFIHNAIYWGVFLDHPELFLRLNFDLNTKDSEGDTILHHLASMDELEALAALLSNKKGSVDTADANGCTPLIIATRLGSVEHIKLLIQKGANPTIKDKNGNSALSIAAESQDDELRKLFNLKPCQQPELPKQEAVAAEAQAESKPKERNGVDQTPAEADGNKPLSEGKKEEVKAPIAIATPEITSKKKKHGAKTKRSNVSAVNANKNISITKKEAEYKTVSYPEGQTKQQFLDSIWYEIKKDEKLFHIITTNLNDFIQNGGRTYKAVNTQDANVREFRLTSKHRLYVRMFPNESRLEIVGFSGKTRQGNYIANLK